MTDLQRPADLDAMSPEEREVYNQEKRAQEAEEQARLPYRWTQTLADVDITVPVPPGTRGRNVLVQIRPRSLKVALKQSPSTEPIVEGDLFAPVLLDDCTWSVEDQRSVVIHLEKQNAMQWWPHVVTHHPKIDVTLIQPENSSLADLDGETRGMVEKMMYEQRQKEMGKPNIEEARKLAMIEEFKKQHPEMDFSKAQLNM
ncbi:hypothetical protein IWQ61_003294 [Dispira simplex]|nr:hypothetical protein IWQ61_003294 [Dispira simplex]